MIGAALLLAIGTNPVALWIAFPLAVLVAVSSAVAPRSVAVAGAGFSSTLAAAAASSSRRGCLVAYGSCDQGAAWWRPPFPWRWQVINQKREVGVQAADEPGHLTAMGCMQSKLTEVSYPPASGSAAWHSRGHRRWPF